MAKHRRGCPSSIETRAMKTLGVTGRELRVLDLLQRGQSNKLIARELAIEEGPLRCMSTEF